MDKSLVFVFLTHGVETISGKMLITWASDGLMCQVVIQNIALLHLVV